MICGGVNSGGTPTTQAEVYHPADVYCTERLADGIFSRRFNHTYRFTSGPLNNKVLVCGGAQGTFLAPSAVATCEHFNGSAFSTSPYRLQTSRVGAAVSPLPEGALLFAGGAGGTTNKSLDSCELLFY